MRIRKLAVPIAITSALVVLGGLTAWIIWAWSPTPSSVQPNLQAANLPLEPPAEAEPMSMTGSYAPSESQTASDDTLPTLPEKPELKYPNLGSNLDQLVASAEEDAPMHQEASIAVTIHLSGNVDDVVKFLEDKRRLGQQCGRGLHRSLRARITARAGLGTARRHPGAGNHPSGAESELASDHQAEGLKSRGKSGCLPGIALQSPVKGHQRRNQPCTSRSCQKHW